MRFHYFVLSTIVAAAPVIAQERLDSLGQPFAYDSTAPLDVRQRDSTIVGHAVIRDISYASPKGGRVPGFLVVPMGSGPFAGVVFVHWGQGNRSEFVAEAVELTRRGVESLLIDAPFNRVDDPNRKTPDPRGERDGYVQLVIDIRRAIDLLLARSDIDRSRIGYVGHSLGATWGGVVAGLDHRVRAFVLMGGLPTLTDFDFPDAVIQQQATNRSPAALDAYVRTVSPINPIRFVGRSSPAHLFFQWATFDRYISKRAAQRYFDAAGQPKTQQWYLSSHEFNDPRARSDRDKFLATQLRFADAIAGNN